MSTDQDRVHQGFVRQRRSLLVVSLVLLAFQYTEATLSKVQVFGNELVLRSPLDITLPLWIAWTYFGVRYYQHLRDLQDRGIFQAYWTRLCERADAAALKRLARSLPAMQLPLPKDAKRFVDVRRFEPFRGAAPWRWLMSGDVVTKHVKEGAGASRLAFDEVYVDFDNRQLFLHRLRAAVSVVLHTRLVTEYGLPFVVALVPLAIMLWRAVKRAFAL